jgi:dihydropteroate synthase
LSALLRCGRFTLNFSRPLIMGVVNITPDSFSDGGLFFDPAGALRHARQLIDEGADIIDVGGESTRPGAEPVSETDELARILPVVRELASKVPVSVDTMKPAVMRAAIDAGAAMINDVNALRSEGAIQACAQSEVGICLMHMLGEPRTMQKAPEYANVVADVKTFLSERVGAVQAGGIARERICIDPGIGFGKTPDHNMQLLRELQELTSLGYPVLFGASRKSTLGVITGRPVEGRLAASLAMALLAFERGASIVRVHDVAQTRDVLAIWLALRGLSMENPVIETLNLP